MSLVDEYTAILAERMRDEHAAHNLAFDLVNSEVTKEEIRRLVGARYERRDELMRRAHREGLTVRQIARAVGISHQRAGQIIQQ